MEAADVVLVTWPDSTAPEPLSLAWYIQSTVGNLAGFKVYYQTLELNPCAVALATAIGTGPIAITADRPLLNAKSVVFTSPENYQLCDLNLDRTFLAMWQTTKVRTTKSVNDYIEACRLANKSAFSQRSSSEVHAAIGKVQAAVPPAAVIGPESAVTLAEHLEQYIAAKAEEFKHFFSGRLPASSHYEEVEKSLEESALTVNALSQQLKAVRTEEEEVLANTFQRVSKLSEDLVALQEGLRKAVCPVRMSAGRCAEGFFLILQCMNVSTVIDVRVTCIPEVVGVLPRLLLYREVHLVPIDIWDFNKTAVTIALRDADGVYLTKHSLTLTKSFLQVLPEVVPGQNFADLRKEQVVMAAAVDKFYLKFPGKQAKTTLNVYEKLGQRQEFSAEEVLANMEAELDKDRR